MACNKTVDALAMLLAEVAAKEDCKFCDKLAAHIKAVFGQDVMMEAVDLSDNEEYGPWCHGGS